MAAVGFAPPDSLDWDCHRHGLVVVVGQTPAEAWLLKSRSQVLRCSEEEHLQEGAYRVLLLWYPIAVKMIIALYAAAPIEDQQWRVHKVDADGTKAEDKVPEERLMRSECS
ncbi:hypothetical protein llap_9288 [Limosa lapponica baueri]|uniref:Uncharacterized protein n=1 Tax=Limosa lapponica baueri TaxID=1758121 RepID=A0A2I0U2W1_LIMLA|nr:hypothetical protein llap_9288 [Limosa lapponica baueri]